MPDPTPDQLSRRATVADGPTQVDGKLTTANPLPHFTRRTVAWTLTLGALRVGLRRSERRGRREGRAA
jgi:hypothetical protein